MDAIDTLWFEDMDGDGYLDMHIVYPEHCVVAETHIIVQQGDSLWRIAPKYLGDGEKYTDLYDRNKAVIGGNPYRIMPGMELDVADIGENEA